MPGLTACTCRWSLPSRPSWYFMPVAVLSGGPNLYAQDEEESLRLIEKPTLFSDSNLGRRARFFPKCRGGEEAEAAEAATATAEAERKRQAQRQPQDMGSLTAHLS